MPYISGDEREIVEEHGPKTVGQLTYAITGELVNYLDNKWIHHETIRYADLAECLAALEGAKLDLIERVINPYERKKAEENMDVWGHRVIEAVGGRHAGY